MPERGQTATWILNAATVVVSLFALGVLLDRHMGDAQDLGVVLDEAQLSTEPRRLGPQSSRVSIVVFSDYSCGWCLKFSTTLDSLSHRDGRVRVVYRDFVLDTTSPALMTHAGARCAAEQSRFAEYHRAAFASFRLAELRDWHRRIARSLPDLAADEFESCVASDTVVDSVRGETERGRQLGFTLTPSGFIGRIRFEGALEAAQLDSLVDAAMRMDSR